MTASIQEIDLATRGAGIRKRDLARLLGVTPGAVTGQLKRGCYSTIRIGGAEFVKTDQVRAAFGLSKNEAQ